MAMFLVFWLCLAGLLVGPILAGEDQTGSDTSARAQAPFYATFLLIKDKQTGKLRKPTPVELAELSASDPLNRSVEGLKQTHGPGKATGLDLGGRFQNVVLARVDANGNLVTTCVASEKEMRAFLSKQNKAEGLHVK